MRNIVVYIGSSRKNGNTYLLAENYKKGAEAAGHTVISFFAGDMEIHPCLDCRACCKDNAPCVQKDDMQRVYAALEACDTVVFASPLYFDGFSAQMKLVLDRLYCLGAHNGFRYPHKDCGLIMVGESNRQSCFDISVAHYRRVFQEYMGWSDLGMVLARGADQPGDVLQKPEYQEAYTFGRNL